MGTQRMQRRSRGKVTGVKQAALWTQRKREAKQSAGKVTKPLAVVRWEQPVLKVVRFLENLPVSNCVHGEKWATRMRAYYRDRFDALIKAAPPGAEPWVTEYTQRVLAVTPKG